MTELSSNATYEGEPMDLTAETSHGNQITSRGDCPVCGRKDVALTPVAGREVCANNFACFAAWRKAKVDA